jgi:hypothetical protein
MCATIRSKSVRRRWPKRFAEITCILRSVANPGAPEHVNAVVINYEAGPTDRKVAGIKAAYVRLVAEEWFGLV